VDDPAGLSPAMFICSKPWDAGTGHKKTPDIDPGLHFRWAGGQILANHRRLFNPALFGVLPVFSFRLLAAY